MLSGSKINFAILLAGLELIAFNPQNQIITIPIN
jgi:hypothetical protein